MSKARSTEEESSHGIRYRNKVESDVDVGALDLYYIVATPNSFTTTNQRGVSRERSTEFFFSVIVSHVTIAK